MKNLSDFWKEVQSDPMLRRRVVFVGFLIVMILILMIGRQIRTEESVVTPTPTITPTATQTVLPTMTSTVTPSPTRTPVPTATPAFLREYVLPYNGSRYLVGGGVASSPFQIQLEMRLPCSEIERVSMTLYDGNGKSIDGVHVPPCYIKINSEEQVVAPLTLELKHEIDQRRRTRNEDEQEEEHDALRVFIFSYTVGFRETN